MKKKMKKSKNFFFFKFETLFCKIHHQLSALNDYKIRSKDALLNFILFTKIFFFQK